MEKTVESVNEHNRNEGMKHAALVAGDIGKNRKMYGQTVMFNGCGTPACIAGHAAIRRLNDMGTKVDRMYEYVDDTGEEQVLSDAQAYLGLTDGEAEDMFQAWPYGHGEWATAEDAVAMLKAYAEGKGVEWPEREKRDEAGT